MRNLLPLFLFVLFVTGCVSYNQISFQPADLSSSQRFIKNIHRYTIIVHQDDKISVLEGQEISDNSIKAKARFITKDSIVEKPISKESILKHRKDVHLYMKPESSLELPVSSGQTKNITLQLDDVRVIKAYTSNESDIIGTVFIVLGAVLLGFLALVVLFVVVIALLFLTFAGAFNGNNNSTGNGSNSGGSNSSGSGSSNSGGSNSGGSGSSNSGGSGGSGSSSGCYIATMAYGDYDHPQVLKLRRFRDEVLSQSDNGRKFIKIYYTYSPIWVERTKSFTILHQLLRVVLNGFIKCLSK
jgi:hypothetical protein